MMYPLVRELAEGFPVTVTCRVLNMARQPYYRWLETPVSDRAWVQAHQLNALVDANRADPEIVGYSISHRMTSTLVVDATTNAVARCRDVTGCVVHADRGSQFRSKALQDALPRHGLILSMGRVASTADNAAMESFHSLLQGNVPNRRTWDTRDELRLAIVTWIETKYHRRRRRDRLGRLTPIEYEAKITSETGHAA